MNKFTPGAWIAEQRDTRSVVLAAKGRRLLADCPQWSNRDDRPRAAEAFANAKLFAAAPDLLEAAQLALQIAESWIHDQLDGTSSIDGALLHLDPVRAAIARARGEA